MSIDQRGDQEYEIYKKCESCGGDGEAQISDNRVITNITCSQCNGLGSFYWGELRKFSGD